MSKRASYVEWIPSEVIGNVHRYFATGEGQQFLPPCKLNSDRCPLKNISLFKGLAHGIADGRRGQSPADIEDFLIRVIKKYPSVMTTSADQQGRTPFTKGVATQRLFLGLPAEPPAEPTPAPVPPAPAPAPKFEPVPMGKDKVMVPMPDPSKLPADAPQEIRDYIITDEFKLLYQHYWINMYLHRQSYFWYGGDKGLGKTLACEALGWYVFGKATTIVTAPKDWNMDVVGYVSPITNERITTPAAETMIHGGLILIDEPTKGFNEVMNAFNQVLQSRSVTLPGIGQVKIHEDCMFIASDNTFGEGGNEMYIGEQQDASLLSRFPKKLTAQWSDKIAKKICPYEEWVKFMKDWNQSTLKAGMPRHQKFYRELAYIAEDMKRNEMFNVDIYTPEAIMKNNFTDGMIHDELTTIYNGLKDKSSKLAVILGGVA